MNLSGLPIGKQQIVTVADKAFQQVSVLHFGPAAGADGISIAAAQFKGSFAPYEYDALTTNDAEIQVSVQPGDKALIVTLPSPRQIRRVTLAASVVASAGQIEFYRLDGTKLSGAAVATALSGGWLDAEFTANSFAIRYKINSGDYSALKRSDLTGLLLRSYPATPRLGLLAGPGAAQPGSLSFFWQQPGEVGRPTPPVAGQTFIANKVEAKIVIVSAVATGSSKPGIGVFETERLSSVWSLDPPGDSTTLPADAGTALADALTRYMAALPHPLSTDVTLSLVIAADAPCVFAVEQAAVTYHLLRNSLPGGAPKQVLRFADDHVAVQTLSLTLPGGAAIASAALDLVSSLRASGASGASSDADLRGPDGAHVGTAIWVGQQLAVGASTTALGVTIGLLSLTGQTQLLLEIQEDYGGLPSGKKLAGATLAAPAAGERAWMTLRFGAPVSLPPLCWLLLKAAQGQAIWLAQAAAGAAIQLLDRADPGAPWQQSSAIANLCGLYRLLTSAEQNAPPLGVSLVGQQIALSASPATAPGPAQPGAAGGKLHADFAAALGAFLATQPAGRDANVPLLFTAVVGGLVTVYAPRIEFDI